MWDSNAPLQLLQSMPRQLTAEHLEKLQLVIDADKYKNSLVSGFDLCGMYAPFCRGCRKTSIFPCALAYINMMQTAGLEVEIGARPMAPEMPQPEQPYAPTSEPSYTDPSETAFAQSEQPLAQPAASETQQPEHVETQTVASFTEQPEEVQEEAQRAPQQAYQPEPQPAAQPVEEQYSQPAAQSFQPYQSYQFEHYTAPALETKRKIRIAVARKKM